MPFVTTKETPVVSDQGPGQAKWEPNKTSQPSHSKESSKVEYEDWLSIKIEREAALRSLNI